MNTQVEANIRRLFSTVRSVLALDGIALSDEEFQQRIEAAVEQERENPGSFDAGAESLARDWQAAQTS